MSFRTPGFPTPQAWADLATMNAFQNPPMMLRKHELFHQVYALLNRLEKLPRDDRDECVFGQLVGIVFTCNVMRLWTDERERVNVNTRVTALYIDRPCLSHLIPYTACALASMAMGDNYWEKMAKRHNDETAKTKAPDAEQILKTIKDHVVGEVTKDPHKPLPSPEEVLNRGWTLRPPLANRFAAMTNQEIDVAMDREINDEFRDADKPIIVPVPKGPSK